MPGEVRLLNPLSIRFSQPRVAPSFRDGHNLEETMREIDLIPFQDVCPRKLDRESRYDMVLVPPFPSIRVIVWSPKLRNSDGEPWIDSDGQQLYGERAWFALDNRRLYAFKRKALAALPKRCCIVVRCLEEAGSALRELRKFRTTSEGRVVEVSARFGRGDTWWDELREDVEEPLDTDRLLDASSWAPQVVDTGVERTNLELEAIRHQRRRDSLSKAKVAELVACPDNGWQYIDPSGTIQGPFPLDKMRLWHQKQYFSPELPMRCHGEDAFVPFCELFPKPVEPFKSCVMRHKG